MLQAARDLVLAMGCIETQRSSPSPPPDDPSDKPMGEMLLNMGAGSGDGMCAQVSSVPGLQMLLLTQVRGGVVPACWCWCRRKMQHCWSRHDQHGRQPQCRQAHAF